MHLDISLKLLRTMSEDQETMSPNICFISYHPDAVFSNIEHELMAWRDCAMALVGQGYQVHWITSVDNMSAHTWETVWGLALVEDLPSTCRCRCARGSAPRPAQRLLAASRRRDFPTTTKTRQLGPR